MVPRLYAAHTEECRVRVDAGRAVIEGNLTVPPDARGVVLVVDCSGETLHRPSNISIAEVLRRAGLATFVLDLVTAEEAQCIGAGGTARFDMQLLAERVRAAIDWLMRDPSTGGLRIGCFGRDAAAAAVLVAAAEHPERVSARVIHDGRPDLASEALECVRAPTLFIVAGDDALSIRLNEYALGALRCEKRLQVMPCPKCRFEHPVIMEWAAEIARDWLRRYLSQAPVPGALSNPRIARLAHDALNPTRPARTRTVRGRPTPRPRTPPESRTAARGSSGTGRGAGVAPSR